MKWHRQLQKERIWELDAVRGFLILAVLVNHLNITVNAFCINGYYNIDSFKWAQYTDPLNIWFTVTKEGILGSASWVTELRSVCTYPAVNTFFIISGICCTLSRSNLKRGLKLLLGAVLISLFTKLLAIWTGDPTRFIRFGVLHSYAYCHFIYFYFLEKRSNLTLLGVALLAFVIGYYLRWNPIESDIVLLYPFGIHESGVVSNDYWPIFPMLGWLLCGVVLGRKIYTEMRSRYPDNRLVRYTKLLQFLGRHSGKIYFFHVFIYVIVFCGVGIIFNLL